MNILIEILVLIFLPPLLPGLINRTKALIAGRKGPPVLQLYYDLAKLQRKKMVLSSTTSWIFFAGPVVTVAACFLAALFVPQGNLPAPVSFTGDVILFAYLLGLARFFTAAAALDTGSAFEGMGAAREVTFACLAEPALFFGLLVMARLSGELSLSPMLANPWSFGWSPGAAAALALVAAGWFVVLLVENCRVPFDDPNTHLELTMIHEVMVLDHSGPALGLILYGASLKFFVLGALLLRLLVPFSSGNAIGDIMIFLGSMTALAILTGIVESMMARLRLVAVPKILVAVTLVSAFALVLLVR
ncbi:MAG: NADH-quinone oxidoreductase subunit H [Candidatus Hydrogenedentota bacterium]